MIDKSFWLDMPYTPRPALDRDLTTDVVVVGGGITGVSTAYHCAKQGLKTVLIEKETIASGSAGRNGGMVVEGFSMDFIEAVERFGMENAKTAWMNTVAARKTVQSLIAEHNIDCDFSQPGSLYSAQIPEDAEWIRKEAVGRKAAGIDCELIEKGIGTKGNPFLLHLFNPNDGMLHPVKFVRGLVQAAEKYGAVFFENTEALQFSERAVVTRSGTIHAGKVVLALETNQPNHIVPERGTLAREQAIVTAPLTDGQMAALDWPIGGMFWTENPEYTNIRKLGNRLFTSYDVSLNPTPEELEHHRSTLLRLIYHCLPGLAGTDIKISHHWTGKLFFTLRSRPYIGQTNGLYEVYGQSGNGLTNGIMAGQILAKSFSGTEIPVLYNLLP